MRLASFLNIVEWYSFNQGVLFSGSHVEFVSSPLRSIQYGKESCVQQRWMLLSPNRVLASRDFVSRITEKWPPSWTLLWTLLEVWHVEFKNIDLCKKLFWLIFTPFDRRLTWRGCFYLFIFIHTTSKAAGLLSSNENPKRLFPLLKLPCCVQFSLPPRTPLKGKHIGTKTAPISVIWPNRQINLLLSNFKMDRSGGKYSGQ